MAIELAGQPPRRPIRLRSVFEKAKESVRVKWPDFEPKHDPSLFVIRDQNGGHDDYGGTRVNKTRQTPAERHKRVIALSREVNDVIRLTKDATEREALLRTAMKYIAGPR